MHRIASRMPEHGPPSPPSANLKGFATTTPFMIKAERVVVCGRVVDEAASLRAAHHRSAIDALRAADFWTANLGALIAALCPASDSANQVICPTIEVTLTWWFRAS